MITKINYEDQERLALVLPKYTAAEDAELLRLSLLDLLSIALSNEETLHKLTVRTCYYVLEAFKGAEQARDEILRLAETLRKETV